MFLDKEDERNLITVIGQISLITLDYIWQKISLKLGSKNNKKCMFGCENGR